MQVILKISQATFGKIKLDMVTKAPDDYYAPSSMHPSSSTWTAYDCEKVSGIFKDTQQDYLKNIDFPFNVFWSKQRTSRTNPNLDGVSITYRWG